MEQVKCSECTNLNCFIHQLGSDAFIRKATREKSQSWYKKGQYIITEGAPVRGIYFILRGKVKVVSTGIYNHEQIVRLASDGHILGHRGYGGEIYPIGAVAIESTILCFLNNEVLKEFFLENPRFTYAMMMFYSKELRKAEKRIKYLSQMTVREKVAESLLYYIDTFGFDKRTGLISVDLPRKDISDLAGTNPNQVSRALSEFKNENIIKVSGKHIHITDLDQLKEVVIDYDIL